MSIGIASCAKDDENDNILVGTWVSGGNTLIFSNDGTGSLSGNQVGRLKEGEFTYKITDSAVEGTIYGKVAITYKSGSKFTCDFEIPEDNDNELYIEGKTFRMQ